MHLLVELLEVDRNHVQLDHVRSEVYDVSLRDSQGSLLDFDGYSSFNYFVCLAISLNHREKGTTVSGLEF